MAKRLMVDIKTIPNLMRLAGALSYWSGELRSTKPVLKEAVDEVVRPRIRENFASESAAGNPWAQLSETTVKDRLSQGYDSGPILNRTGTLAEAAQQANIWTFRGSQGEAFIKGLPDRAWYGVVHDQGLLAPQVPQREFFVINEDDEEEIREILTEWVAFNFNKTVGAVGGRTTLGGLMNG